jgi:hypothetical protein
MFLGARCHILATSDSTEGKYGLVDMIEVPPGDMPPLHVHHTHDEGFLLLEGEISLFLPDREIALRSGALRRVRARATRSPAHLPGRRRSGALAHHLGTRELRTVRRRPRGPGGGDPGGAVCGSRHPRDRDPRPSRDDALARPRLGGGGSDASRHPARFFATTHTSFSEARPPAGMLPTCIPAVAHSAENASPHTPPVVRFAATSIRSAGSAGVGVSAAVEPASHRMASRVWQSGTGGCEARALTRHI